MLVQNILVLIVPGWATNDEYSAALGFPKELALVLTQFRALDWDLLGSRQSCRNHFALSLYISYVQLVHLDCTPACASGRALASGSLLSADYGSSRIRTRLLSCPSAVMYSSAGPALTIAGRRISTR